jgi:4-hydroxy-3-polyprenylbenzoate decarboxylase
LVSFYYDIDDLSAPLAGGGFNCMGMVVAPCSMKTLAGIASGYTQNLLLRAADVTLKEGRKLVVVPRETPLNIIHLENMLKLARAGAVILPAMPAFYHKPKTINDLANHIVGKILEAFNLEHSLYRKWKADYNRQK